MKICSKCGNACGDESKFCTKCGTLFQQQPLPSQVDKSQKKKNGLLIGLVIVFFAILLVGVIVVATVLLKKPSSSDSDWEDLTPIEKSEIDLEHKNTEHTDDQDVTVDADQQEEPDEAIADPVEAAEESVDSLEEEYAVIDYTTHRYDIIIDDVDWNEAQRECMSRGGHLVTFDSEEEMAYVLDYIDSEMEEHYNYYVGARRDPNSQVYRWLDKDGLYYGDSVNPDDCAWLSSYWLGNEPSFSDENGNDECYVDLIYVKGKWVLNDIPVDLTGYYPGKVAYVIEWDA